MLIIWGWRVVYHTIAQGMFYCRKCGGDRAYRHRAGRRFITVFFIPLIPLTKAGEHVQCGTCKTRYVTEVLASPTAASMQAAIPAGVRALVSVVLRTGGSDSEPARGRAIDAVRSAGQEDYDEAMLAEDLSHSLESARQMISQLGGQLRPEAKEWHLAEAVRIAMADGPLTENERATVEMIASDLGMTQAQALGVITLTEQAAGHS
jgi:Tellurite resistance protein TerB